MRSLFFHKISANNLLGKQVTFDSAELACLGKNTEYHEIFRRCVCKKGFPFGNPEKGGCYACNNVTCHPNGYCAAMNTCKCKQGQIGDGITFCDHPRPKITLVEPTVCTLDEDSFITFAFSTPNGYNVTKPDCRFGPRVVTPMEFNGTHGVCKCPPSVIGTYPFALSFNRIYWSNESYNITFTRSYSSTESVFSAVEITFLIIALIFISVWYIPKAIRKNTEDADQILPLNKWHMSQSTHESGNEQNFFKYLLGLLI